MAKKLPAVALVAIGQRLKEATAEVADLTAILAENEVDVKAVLAGDGTETEAPKKGGMSKAQRKALSEKMKAKHAAAKAAKEASQGGVPGDAAPASEPAGIDLGQAVAPAATPA